MYSIKGNVQMLAPAIIPVAACCLVQKVAYFMKDMRIEREHKITLKCWDPELTRVFRYPCRTSSKIAMRLQYRPQPTWDSCEYSVIYTCARVILYAMHASNGQARRVRAWRRPLNVVHVGGLRVRGTYTVHVHTYNNCCECVHVHAHTRTYHRY